MPQQQVSFETWMSQVDAAVSGMAFISVYDLADQPFRDWYNDGYSPREAAEEALESEGYPMEALLL
ncbi:MAG: hypothetical protein GY803_08085 [Chloroflexi bacterium]|nr:hypothetical protein [Chloroflexota bacterium]